MNVFLRNARARNGHVEATLNHPFPAQVDLGDALVRVGVDAVLVVPEVEFKFWAHVTLRGAAPYAFWERPKVVFGAGAWYRNSSPALRERASALFKRLAAAYDGSVVRLTDLEESVYEEMSMIYAHRHNGLKMPDAVLAVGNGSTQFSCIAAPEVGDRVAFLRGDDVAKRGELHCGADSVVGKMFGVVVKRRRHIEPGVGGAQSTWHYDVALEAKAGDRPPPRVVKDVRTADVKAAPLEKRAPFERTAVPRGPSDPGPRETAPYLIQIGNRIGSQFFDCFRPVRDCAADWRTYASGVLDAMVLDSELSSGTAKTVTCMSACFYAAKFAGVACNPETTTARDAKAAYQKALDAIFREAEVIETAHEGPKRKASDVLKEVAKARGPDEKKYDVVVSNLTYQVLLCDMLGLDVELRIARDWYLGDPAEPAKKGYKFRTTWSSGWYLDYIVRKKTALLGLEGTGFKNLI